MKEPATKEYINEKIKVLKELGIKLTPSQTDHIRSLKSEIDVDNFARSLIQKKRSGWRY